MKKILVLILAVLMIFNLAACSKNAEDNSSKTATSSASNNTQKERSQLEEEKGVLTVCSASVSPLLKQAAGRYHELHPEITIEIKEYLPVKVEKSGNTAVSKKPSSEDTEKYVNTINTQLIGGTGPDIILVDKALPYYKYIDKNLFVDMNKLMQADKDFNSDKYFMNIFKALEYKKGLYTIPTGFYFPMIAAAKDMSNYSDDQTWSIKDFLAASQKVINESKSKDGFKYISAMTDSDLFSLFFADSFSQVVNMEKRSAQFTSNNFINLMKQCKAASDNNLLGKMTDKSFKPDSKHSLIDFDLIISAAFMKASTTKSPDNNKTFLHRLPTIDGKKSVSFYSTDLYAINKNSKKIKMAWNFIKFLLSNEMQASEGTTFPVEKEAFKQKEKDSFKFMYKDLSEKDITELVGKYHNDIVNIISDINTYSYVDPKINKILDEEVKAFFMGQKSAENTAAAIQNKVNIYLNE